MVSTQRVVETDIGEMLRTWREMEGHIKTLINHVERHIEEHGFKYVLKRHCVTHIVRNEQ